MAQQKSEDRVVPEGGVMPVERAGSSPGGQGKAVPVEETAVQLGLPIATAENPKGTTRRRTRDRLGEIRAGAPKAIDKTGTAAPATMEEVAYRLTDALLKVASNKGAPGPDGQTIEALLEQWFVVLPGLQADLLAGTYRPGGIRRVFIPKAGGGQRGLGIPDVVDRVVQEAVRQVLEPLWEPTFHPSNHGFRPGRSCHTAIAEAKTHLEDGYEWCVDLDLEKFFDLVCHQRLTAKLAERVSDRRLLVLIGRMLKAKVVLPDGVVVNTEQGVPQGGPLSPLLSNIVLDELDQELDRRGHRFARYADDAKVYVRSERAGQRVMASLTEFIERRLRLKVNQGQVGCRPSGGPSLPRIPAASRSAHRDRRGAALGAHQAQRDAEGQAAHTENLGKHAIGVRRPDQRVAARLVRVLRDRLPVGDAGTAQDRRPFAAAVTRDPAAPLETQTNDRTQPHQAGRQARQRVAPALLGTEVLVGAEPHARGRSGPAQRVLRQARADLPDRHAPQRDASRSSSPNRRNWRCGDDFEVANRPAAGVITRRPEEPYTNSVRTVLWEPGRATAPATRAQIIRIHPARGVVE